MLYEIFIYVFEIFLLINAVLHTHVPKCNLIYRMTHHLLLFKFIFFERLCKHFFLLK